MDGFACRAARPDDVAAIRALSREAYASWVPLIGREPMPMTANYETAVADHVFALLHRDEALVALIEMIRKDEHLVIENVAVRPDHQGRGLGRHLLAHAEGVARAMGFREIRLYTNKMFARNIEIYRKVGYRVDREEVWSGGTAVHMSKPI